MSTEIKKNRSENELRLENEELRMRLEEANETLDAIRSGDVDAIVVNGTQGEKIFSLSSVETPYRIFVEKMNEGAVSLTPDGIILFCNRRFSEIVSVPLQNITGSSFTRFVQDNEMHYFERLLTAARKENCKGIITYTGNNSIQKYLHLSVSPMPEERNEALILIVSDITNMKNMEVDLISSNENLENKVKDRTNLLERTIQELSESRLAMLNMMEDAIEAKDALKLSNGNLLEEINERKLAENEILRLNDELENRVIQRTAQLEESNRELEAFSYSVSHDLRAPIRSIHSFTSILLEDYSHLLDNEGKRICGIIASSGVRMGELIDDLLNYSRIGRSSMNIIPLDMQSIANSVFSELTSETEKKRITLTIENLHRAAGDPKLIKLVLSNLISNALKYSSKEAHPEIHIGSKEHNSIVEYYVKDNGVGFEMKYKNKLFGVFQRLHSEKEFEGNGVGLAIVLRIISNHGGTVRAEGEPGNGAVFYFSLPVATDPILMNMNASQINTGAEENRYH